MFDINLKLWKLIICNVYNRIVLYIVWILFVLVFFGDLCIDCCLINVGVFLCKMLFVVNEIIVIVSLFGNSLGFVVILELLCISCLWMK